MISEELVFGSSSMLEVMAVQSREDQVIISVQSRKTQDVCPACKVNSTKLHSHYYRKIKDLPAFNNKVCLHIKARKWYCHNELCNQKIFTESLEHYVQRYQRFCNRLREKLLNIALLMGSKTMSHLKHSHQ